MKNLRYRPALLCLLAAALLALGAFAHWYLKYHLVVAAEGHEHAHSHEEEAEHGSEGEGEEAEGGGEAAAGTNLVTNYSFEVGSLLDIYGWTPVGFDPGTSAWRDLETAADGFASAALSSDSSSNGCDLLWRQPLSGFPGDVDLEVRGKVKCADLSGRAFIRVSGIKRYQDGVGQTTFIDIGGPSGSSDWQEFQGTVYLPRGIEFLAVEVGLFGVGKAWFDGISVTPRERSSAPPPYDANLLINPSFEEGLAGWGLLVTDPYVRAGWGTGSGGPDGRSLLFIQPVTPGPEPNPTFFFQAVNNLDGASGTAHLEGMVDAGSLQGQASLLVALYTLDAVYTVRPLEPLSGGEGWRRLSCSAPVPPGVQSAWVYLSAEGSGTARFSDIDFRLSP